MNAWPLKLANSDQQRRFCAHLEPIVTLGAKQSGEANYTKTVLSSMHLVFLLFYFVPYTDLDKSTHLSRTVLSEIVFVYLLLLFPLFLQLL